VCKLARLALGRLKKTKRAGLLLPPILPSVRLSTVAGRRSRVTCSLPRPATKIVLLRFDSGLTIRREEEGCWPAIRLIKTVHNAYG